MKWFKHDCDASRNPDIKILIDTWGWDWYGRWWGICERIGERINENHLTFSLQTNNGHAFPVKLLANELGTTVRRLSDFCLFLADNRLIDKEAWYNKNVICIPNLKKRADEYTKKLLTKSRHTPDQEEDTEVDKKKTTTTQTGMEHDEVDGLSLCESDFKNFLSSVQQLINTENKSRNGNPFHWQSAKGSSFESDMQRLIYGFKNVEKMRILVSATNMLHGELSWSVYLGHVIRYTIRASKKTALQSPIAFAISIARQPDMLSREVADGSLSDSTPIRIFSAVSN